MALYCIGMDAGNRAATRALDLRLCDNASRQRCAMLAHDCVGELAQVHAC